MNRKFFLFLLLVSFLSTLSIFLLAPEKNDNKGLNLGKGRDIFSDESNLSKCLDFVEREVLAGNLRSFKKDVDKKYGTIHERFEQYYRGVKVFGAQIVVHKKDEKVYSINGNYYENISIDTKAEIKEFEAIERAINDADIPGLSASSLELVIYPSSDGYFLAFRIVLEKFGVRIVYFVDAKKGNIIANYSDLKYQASIGLGYGTWGDRKKFSSFFEYSDYWPKDYMRPARIYTYDMKNSLYQGYWTTTTDNIWRDGALVDAHTYLGWTYDYYYKVHEREGIDDSNMVMKAFVHYYYNYNNAFWDGYEMVFGDGDGINFKNFASALDVVAHEFTHGVTQFSSDLIYWGESGALNEAFSDIIGVCVEFYFQKPGNGRLLADWWEGEDLFINFGYAFRYFDDPTRSSFWGGPYPDHYSKIYKGSSYDHEFVHINSSIANHCFYLLANGGTNKTSGITVQGIGREKAEKIFYRGFVYYLWSSSNFSNARWATVQAASDIYGANSTEKQRVEQAWTAVGVF